nr:uncharacterized protein LOC126534770 [Dermacentor andersoni]
MDLVKPPQPLVLSGSTVKNWSLFKQRFELFLQATEQPKETRTPERTNENKEDYETVTKKFEEYCKQQQNEVYERTRQQVKEFSELFQGIGCLARQYHIVLRDYAAPVVQLVRRVPLVLLEPLREELDRMERAGIVAKVSEPTDWVSPFVAALKKDGKLRICIDPRRINECLKREHYQMPRREDIEAELAEYQEASVHVAKDVPSLLTEFKSLFQPGAGAFAGTTAGIYVPEEARKPGHVFSSLAHCHSA